MFRIPDEFMAQFTIRECPDCGLEHAPIRTCEEAKVFHDAMKKGEDQ